MRAHHLLSLALLLSACRGETDTDTGVVDADGDGVAAAEDCNDHDAAVFPGAAELCNGIDDDCDGEIDEEATDASTWHADADGDGYGDASVSLTACDAPEGYVSDATDCDDADAAYHPGATEDDCTDPADYNCDGSVGFADADADGFAACLDCDDTNAAINPDAAEVCDGVDNDCDGEIDEDDATGGDTFYADADADGFGDAGTTVERCAQPEGYVASAGDCDDANAAINPDADEVCDGIDNDCDDQIDEDPTDAITWYIDADGDGHGHADTTATGCAAPGGYVSAAGDCDDTDASVHPGADEVCNGVDDDCDGAIPVDEQDVDGDGLSACEGDCDDGDADVKPGLDEVCDGKDNDCDESIDEEPSDGSTWYADTDDDGYGDPAAPAVACAAPSGHVTDDTDCDDTDAAINPGAAEACDGVDNDCSGLPDDDDALLGESSGCAAVDCREVHDARPGAPDDVYWVDPRGAGPFEVYCDMSTDVGGWTLAYATRRFMAVIGADPGVSWQDFDNESLTSLTPDPIMEGHAVPAGVDEVMWMCSVDGNDANIKWWVTDLPSQLVDNAHTSGGHAITTKRKSVNASQNPTYYVEGSSNYPTYRYWFLHNGTASCGNNSTWGGSCFYETCPSTSGYCAAQHLCDGAQSNNNTGRFWLLYR